MKLFRYLLFAFFVSILTLSSESNAFGPIARISVGDHWTYNVEDNNLDFYYEVQDQQPFELWDDEWFNSPSHDGMYGQQVYGNLIDTNATFMKFLGEQYFIIDIGGGSDLVIKRTLSFDRLSIWHAARGNVFLGATGFTTLTMEVYLDGVLVLKGTTHFDNFEFRRSGDIEAETIVNGNPESGTYGFKREGIEVSSTCLNRTFYQSWQEVWGYQAIATDPYVTTYMGSEIEVVNLTISNLGFKHQTFFTMILNNASAITNVIGIDCVISDFPTSSSQMSADVDLYYTDKGIERFPFCPVYLNSTYTATYVFAAGIGLPIKIVEEISETNSVPRLSKTANSADTKAIKNVRIRNLTEFNVSESFWEPSTSASPFNLALGSGGMLLIAIYILLKKNRKFKARFD